MNSQQLKCNNIEKVKLKYELITNETVYLPAVCGTFDPMEPPNWFDQDKFIESQRICRKYFYSIFVSLSIGNLLAFQGPSFVDPVLTTGNHSSIAKMYRRYLATAFHILKWFQSDPFTPKSPAFRSFSQVRSMHMRLCTSMNEQKNLKIGKDKLHSSLHDIIMSIFPFIGLFTNYPIACGAHKVTKEELEKVIYSWRVFVYALGIDDKYNICDGSIEEFNQLYRLYEENYLIPLLSKVPHSSPVGWEVSQGYITAIKQINFSLNFNSLICYWFNVIGVPVSMKLNTFEWLLMKITNIFTFYLLQFRYFYSLMNNFLIYQLEQHKKNRNRIADNLERRYSDIQYESSCPMNEDSDYRDDLTD